MDRLPKRKELVFDRVRKALYLQLTTVIRSLGGKFNSGAGRELLQWHIENLKEPVAVESMRTKRSDAIFCILAEVCCVKWYYQIFLHGKSGDGRSTKKIRAGIKRLEFLRDNWDNLEVTGDLKSGYQLVLKSAKS